MKGWLVAALLVGLAGLTGCESSKEQQAPKEGAETNTPAEDQASAEADEAEKAEANSAEPGAKANKGGLPDNLEAGKTGHYGQKFSLDADPITLAKAIETADERDGPVKIAGAIEKVCKKKGCWFTLTGDGVDQPVRVRMKDYAFFVPRNTDGGEVVVEGMLKKRVIPQKEAQHYADDEVAGTDKPARKVEGDQERWEMMITAAKITQKG